MRSILAATVLLLGFAVAGRATDRYQVKSPPATALPALDSKALLDIPFDEVLTRSNNRVLVFLATLGPDAKPASLLLLDGDTLFLQRVDEAVRQESFGQPYANRQIIVKAEVPRDPVPLRKDHPTVVILENPRNPTLGDMEKIAEVRKRESEVEPCASAMDKDDLIREGYRDENRNRPQAFRCFQWALSKNPRSIAALEGAASTCDEKTDNQCRATFLARVVAERPGYFEGRIALAFAEGGPGDDRQALLELQTILAEDPPPPIQLRILDALTYHAQESGDTAREILYRSQSSEIERRYFALYPQELGRYSRLDIIMIDRPLALLLEGERRWAEAEAVYRRDLPLIAVDPMFEKETQFDFELGLARTLAAQGRSREAASLCSAWKLRANFIAGPGDSFWGYASRPVEIAKWDLSCGKQQQGLARLKSESAAHPWVYATFAVLRDYYYAHGDVQNALKAGKQQSKAHELADASALANTW